jgi:hypothetical protein
MTGASRSPIYNLQLGSGLFESAELPDNSTQHWNMGKRKQGQEKFRSLYAL